MVRGLFAVWVFTFFLNIRTWIREYPCSTLHLLWYVCSFDWHELLPLFRFQLVKQMEKEAEAERQQREEERHKKHKQFTRQKKVWRRKNTNPVRRRKKSKKSASMLPGHGGLSHVHSQDLTVVETEMSSALIPHPPEDRMETPCASQTARIAGASRKFRPLSGDFSHQPPQKARELGKFSSRPKTSEGYPHLQSRDKTTLDISPPTLGMKSDLTSHSNANKENIRALTKRTKGPRSHPSPPLRSGAFSSPPKGLPFGEKMMNSPTTDLVLPPSINAHSGTYHPGDVSNPRYAVPALSIVTQGRPPLANPVPRMRWQSSPPKYVSIAPKKWACCLLSAMMFRANL